MNTTGLFCPIEYFDTGFDQYLGRFAQESMACRRAGPDRRSDDWPVEFEWAEIPLEDFEF